MKKFLIQTVLLLIVIGAGIFFYAKPGTIPIAFLPQPPKQNELKINDAVIKVEVANTQSKRSRGLGGRVSLASDSGMLFIFEKADKYPFWMKGLAFALDFVWIRDSEVVDVLENIQPPASGTPDSSLPFYGSNSPVDKVLEVNAGFVKAHSIKIGDVVKLSP